MSTTSIARPRRAALFVALATAAVTIGAGAVVPATALARTDNHDVGNVVAPAPSAS